MFCSKKYLTLKNYCSGPGKVVVHLVTLHACARGNSVNCYRCHSHSIVSIGAVLCHSSRDYFNTDAIREEWRASSCLF